MLGKVRIISGKWRGRMLNVSEHNELRPTNNRLKETLFNWLSPHIFGANCLDCFSGSGSLGFEAISRGANSAILLEKDPKLAKELQKNQQNFLAENIQIIQTDAINWLENTQNKFDLVFLDPPFNKGFVEKTLELLEKNEHLTENAFIFVESEISLNLSNLSNNWNLYREKNSKEVKCRLYQFEKKQ